MNHDVFLERLRSSGLLAEDRVAEVERRCSAGMTLADLTDGLVSQGWLTQYQLKKLSSGETTRLSVGQYRILEELGQGGFGCVYKAQHVMMNRLVALKVITPALVEDKQARSWFLREVLATTHLNHPNIVLAYDANEVDDVLFLAMEYVDGPNLEHFVRKLGPLSIGLAFAMLQQLGAALEYAHEQKMVHRDIKPANLLIPRRSPQEHSKSLSGLAVRGSGLMSTTLVKVVDFGLARLHDNSRSNTIHLDKEKGFVGTPGYIAPEQARSIHEADIRSDLYSLGCTMYFALTGKAPFRGQTPLQVLMQNLEKEPEPLQKLRPEVPGALVSVIRRMMAKKPEQRFRTPADMLVELNSAFGFAAPAPRATIESQPSIAEEERHSNRHEDADAAQMAELGATVRLAPNAPSPPPDALVAVLDPSIRKSWQQWLAALAAVMQQREPGLSEATYRELHSQLMNALRAESVKARPQPSGGTSAWLTLENLLAPWVTLHALRGMDLETSSGLYQRLASLACQVGWGRSQKSPWSWAVFAAVALIAVGVGLFAFIHFGKGTGLIGPSANQGLKFVLTNPYLILLPFVGAGCALLLARVLRF